MRFIMKTLSNALRVFSFLAVYLCFVGPIKRLFDVKRMFNEDSNNPKLVELIDSYNKDIQTIIVEKYKLLSTLEIQGCGIIWNTLIEIESYFYKKLDIIKFLKNGNLGATTVVKTVFYEIMVYYRITKLLVLLFIFKVHQAIISRKDRARGLFMDIIADNYDVIYNSRRSYMDNVEYTTETIHKNNRKMKMNYVHDCDVDIMYDKYGNNNNVSGNIDTDTDIRFSDYFDNGVYVDYDYETRVIVSSRYKNIVTGNDIFDKNTDNMVNEYIANDTNVAITEVTNYEINENLINIYDDDYEFDKNDDVNDYNTNYTLGEDSIDMSYNNMYDRDMINIDKQDDSTNNTYLNDQSTADLNEADTEVDLIKDDNIEFEYEEDEDFIHIEGDYDNDGYYYEEEKELKSPNITGELGFRINNDYVWYSERSDDEEESSSSDDDRYDNYYEYVGNYSDVEYQQLDAITMNCGSLLESEEGDSHPGSEDEAKAEEPDGSFKNRLYNYFYNNKEYQQMYSSDDETAYDDPEEARMEFKKIVSCLKSIHDKDSKNDLESFKGIYKLGKLRGPKGEPKKVRFLDVQRGCIKIVDTSDRVIRNMYF